MKTTHPAEARILTILGVLILVALVLTIPSPVHDWFVDTRINGVPLKFGLLAVLILFTPPTILSLILRKYDDDDAGISFHDDGTNDHLASHAH